MTAQILRGDRGENKYVEEENDEWTKKKRKKLNNEKKTEKEIDIGGNGR